MRISAKIVRVFAGSAGRLLLQPAGNAGILQVSGTDGGGSSRTITNVILLPIDVGKQDAAAQICSTLNDRGMPLSDANIFESQFCEHSSDEA